MIETIQSINHTLAICGLLGMVGILVLCVDLYTTKFFSRYARTWGLWVAFSATSLSSAMTLLYSEYFDILPCGLCWLERIALYPQILLLLVAIYYKDMMVARYGIALSTFGLSVSLYHHYIQMGGTQFIKCPAAGGVDCAKRFFFEFGFMTFPLMAAILFAFLIIVYLYILHSERQVGN